MNVSVLPKVFCQQFQKTDNFEAKFNFPLQSLTPNNSQSPTILLLFISSELLLLLLSLPLNWQILIFLPKFPFTLIPLFIAQLMTILELIWMVFMIIWEIFHGNLSSNLVLLLLHVSGTRLKLMYISLTVNMMLHLMHLHGFQLFVLLLERIEITFFVCIDRINFMHLQWSSDQLAIVAKGFLKQLKQIV